MSVSHDVMRRHGVDLELSSRRHYHACRLGLLALALISVPFASSYPRENNPIVIIAPQPIYPGPRVQIQQRPPEQPWVPTQGSVSPRIPPPVARCYTGTVTCPLKHAGRVGGTCSCATNSGAIVGRSLIPPSSPRPATPLTEVPGHIRPG
jgi:hypothetical protein